MSARHTTMPGRRGPLADAMRGCCTYTPPGHTEDEGWWTLCPAHAEADRLMRGSDLFRALIKTAANGDMCPERYGDPRHATTVLDAAAAAAGSADPGNVLLLWSDPALASRFLDALEILS